MTRSPLTHAELARACESLRIGMGASDLHGSLTGYLCAGGSAGADAWPVALAIDLGGDTAHRDLLRRLYEDCRRALEDPELGFEPLLPDADAPVERRANALVEWCRGFLGGVGLAGPANAPSSADTREVLADIGRIAASNLDYDSDEDDDSALGEVLEFVRVGVMLLHTEFFSRHSSAGHSVH